MVNLVGGLLIVRWNLLHPRLLLPFSDLSASCCLLFIALSSSGDKLKLIFWVWGWTTGEFWTRTLGLSDIPLKFFQFVFIFLLGLIVKG